jgi:hypothetical protein
MPAMTFANETIVVTSAVTALTPATYAASPGAQVAVITVEAASIRWWASGSNPTAVTGHLAQPGDVLTLTDPNELRRFRAVRAASADATLQVSYGY